MSKESAFGNLLSLYIHEGIPSDPITPINNWVHDNFIPPNPVIPPNPIVPLAQEVSSFVHELIPGDPIMPLGQAVTDYLHNPVTVTDFLLG
jgi:hypothetical protein